MKNKKTLIISCYILLSIISIVPFIRGYWGEGDCRNGHPLQLFDIPFDPKAEVDLDGVPSESFWDNSNNINGTYSVPLAGEFNTSSFFVIYMNLTLVMNHNYLYILCEYLESFWHYLQQPQCSK